VTGELVSDFDHKILSVQNEPIRSKEIRILQMNLGYRCNMSCKHCHVDAGPHRKERMEKEIIDKALDVTKEYSVGTIDLTGGSPEMNPNFTYLIRRAARDGIHIIVRSNLTIFYEKDFEYLPEFYAEYNIEIIASLPHYTRDSVDRVRGEKTFHRSVEGLKRLNSLGYGTGNEKRQLHLVYNPMGAFIPPTQKELEDQYKRELSSIGIVFNKLYTFGNMPVGRFKAYLERSANYDSYMDRLRTAFNPDTLNGLMCRYLINVSWDGTLYDCDFNQILGLHLFDGYPIHINNFDDSVVSGRRIVTGEHCFGCTAGQGST
jgi:radical SAM/Cys-rich protein